jgi:hypothetical protein
MAVITPFGMVQVAFKFVFVEGAEPAICTIGMDVTGYAGTFNAALDAITQAWQDTMLPGQSNALTYLGTTARGGQSVDTSFATDTPRNVAGGNVQAMLTRNTACLVRKTSIRGGRRGRGRMFVPAILPEVEVDQSGMLIPALVTSLQNRATTLFTQLNAIGQGPVILHQDQQVVGYSSSTGKPVYGPVNPGPPDQVTSLIVDPKAATQRRRMR